MDTKKLDIINIRNSDVARLLVGVPRGHEHVRAIIDTCDGKKIILQEATLAAMVRAYTNIKTSPILLASELESVVLEQQKSGYAKHQLIETNKDQSLVQEEIFRLIQ